MQNKLIYKILLGATFATVFAIVTIPSATKAQVLYRQLQSGMTGADVSSLQSFLAKDMTLYPQGLVTGYFGPLTKSAVARFQTRFGISAVGRVGPQTLPVINAQMTLSNGEGVNHVGSDMNAPMISSLGVMTNNNSATVSLMTNEGASLLVYYSTSPISLQEGSASTQVSVSGTSHLGHTDLRTSHSTTIDGLTSNTTYYYVVYSRDAAGNVSLTWPKTFTTTY